MPAVPQDLVVALVMTILVLCSPIIGVLLTVLVIRRERATSQRPLRALLWLLAVAGIALIAVPATRFAGVLALMP